MAGEKEAKEKKKRDFYMKLNMEDNVYLRVKCSTHFK